MIQISERLRTIASLVTAGGRVADVGCDHAFLAIWLIQNGQIPSAIVSDVREGPLSRALEHINEAGLQDKIEARLSDGLASFGREEAETLVIAGMGGPLMERILSEGRKVRDSFKELILQPQSDIPHFRLYLLNEGLQIVDERIVEEDGKFYPMIKAVPGLLSEAEQSSSAKDGSQNQKESNPEIAQTDNSMWSPEEIQYGRFLLQRSDPVMKRFLKREEALQKKILDNLRSGEGENAARRKEEIEYEAILLRVALQRLP